MLQQFKYCCQSGKLKGWKSGEDELCVGPWEAAQAKGAKLAGQEALNNEALKNGDPLPPPEAPVGEEEEAPASSGASAASGASGASGEEEATGASGAAAESADRQERG